MTDRDRLMASLPALQRFLAEQGVSEESTAEIERQFDAGQSNPTYLLRAGERRLVLRKQPYGHLLPKAHDVAREHDIMKALRAAGFAVPIPLAVSRDSDIIGTQFFVMDYVAGEVHSDPALTEVERSRRAPIYHAMADTLADLHRISPDALVSANLRPRPDFIGRQTTIWHQAYLAARTEDDPAVDKVARWLSANKPAEAPPAVVHGDYRIENLIFKDTSIAAVLDWELCAIGDPLSDLAYCCIWYHLPHDVLNGLQDIDLAAAGIPDEAEFVARYVARRGIGPVGSLTYYLVFAFYRLASILQGVYKRALDGNAASPHALARGKIARICLEQARQMAGL